MIFMCFVFTRVDCSYKFIKVLKLETTFYEIGNYVLHHIFTQSSTEKTQWHRDIIPCDFCINNYYLRGLGKIHVNFFQEELVPVQVHFN